MNQNSDRLLDLATELLAARGESDFAAALDRHLPGILTPGSWQIWRREDGAWNCELQGRRKGGFATISPQHLDRLTNTDEEGSSTETGLHTLPLGRAGERADLFLLLNADRPMPQTLEKLGALLVPAFDAIVTRARLEKQTITDEVSGLYNARHFRSLVDYEMERARRYGQDLSVI
ncbi:MAG: hypothetical protein D6751_12295, partial [Deltaproteobacteria bacterium]